MDFRTFFPNINKFKGRDTRIKFQKLSLDWS